MDMSPTSNVIKLETPRLEVPRIGMTPATVADRWGFMPGPLAQALELILMHRDTATPATHLKMATARIKAAKSIEGSLLCERRGPDIQTLAVVKAWELGDYLHGALNDMRAAAAIKDVGLARNAHLIAAEQRVWDEIFLLEVSR